MTERAPSSFLDGVDLAGDLIGATVFLVGLGVMTGLEAGAGAAALEGGEETNVMFVDLAGAVDAQAGAIGIVVVLGEIAILGDIGLVILGDMGPVPGMHVDEPMT